MDTSVNVAERVEPQDEREIDETRTRGLQATVDVTEPECPDVAFWAVIYKPVRAELLDERHIDEASFAACPLNRLPFQPDSMKAKEPSVEPRRESSQSMERELVIERVEGASVELAESPISTVERFAPVLDARERLSPTDEEVEPLDNDGAAVYNGGC